VEILGRDEVHNREESLAVMCIHEKVILGHQSNHAISLFDRVWVYPKTLSSEYIGFLREPSTRESRLHSAGRILTHFELSRLVDTLLLNFRSENDFD
jgi:hypothetical protein